MSFEMAATDSQGRVRMPWSYVCEPNGKPACASGRMTAASCAAMRPMTKNVAGTFSRMRISPIRRIVAVEKPSSNVRATSWRPCVPLRTTPRKDGEGEGRGVGDGDGVGDAVGDGVGIGDGDAVGDGIGDGDGVGDGDEVGNGGSVGSGAVAANAAAPPSPEAAARTPAEASEAAASAAVTATVTIRIGQTPARSRFARRPCDLLCPMSRMLPAPGRCRTGCVGVHP